MTDSTTPSRSAPGGRSRHPGGPDCSTASFALLVLAVVLYAFGAFYLVDPNLSVSSVDAIAQSLHLGLPATPPMAPGAFLGWVGFTFAYMVGAGSCALLASRGPDGREAYLNILLVLKGTSSLVGLGLFVAQPHYAFYLATFLTDGTILGIVWFVRQHLAKYHAAPPRATGATDAPPGPAPD